MFSLLSVLLSLRTYMDACGEFCYTRRLDDDLEASHHGR